MTGEASTLEIEVTERSHHAVLAVHGLIQDDHVGVGVLLRWQGFSAAGCLADDLQPIGARNEVPHRASHVGVVIDDQDSGHCRTPRGSGGGRVSLALVRGVADRRSMRQTGSHGSSFSMVVFPGRPGRSVSAPTRTLRPFRDP